MSFPLWTSTIYTWHCRQSNLSIKQFDQVTAPCPHQPTKTIQWLSLLLEKKRHTVLRWPIKDNLKGHWLGPTYISGFITLHAHHVASWKELAYTCSWLWATADSFLWKVLLQPPLFYQVNPSVSLRSYCSHYFLKEVFFLRVNCSKYVLSMQPFCV